MCSGPPFALTLRRPASVALAFAVAVLAWPAHAQAPLQIGPAADQTADPDPKAAREKELERLRAEQKQAQENEARLAAEIAALGQDRRQLSKALIDTATRLREAEARIAVSENRLNTLDEKERGLRASLEGRKATIAELLAALQRIGRRPPPALLVRPEAALEAVRAAIMLGGVLPEMRAEVETLAADLKELVRVRGEIAAERESLSREIATLAAERERMALLVEERQKRQAEVEKALEAERQRAGALARQAEDLKELIARLDQEAARRQGAPPDGRPDPGAQPPETPKLGPAIAFAAAKGRLPLPVNGVKIRSFGESDGFGGVQKGISVATRAGAQVTAPCDGWVVYAGPFRSYGQLLILNAGGGYHVLLAGMERISVDLGQFVLTGEPVAVMGGGPRTAATVAMGSSQPILYIEFRKDGTPVDPSPWWATTDSEKVRG
ncbi:MAG: murein hydrolase activator EnvC [Variibacter sp.]|nr:murein hydrolase activator EnvC [Variibacter sp.]